jgi:hypothetical protein
LDDFLFDEIGALKSASECCGVEGFALGRFGFISA